MNFAFETTLASRTLAPRISELLVHGYQFHLIFLWLPSADLAVTRVANRARLGGHDVPEDTVRRRYAAGLRNFFNLYQPLAASWRVYNNSMDVGPRLIAIGRRSTIRKIVDSASWNRIEGDYVRER